MTNERIDIRGSLTAIGTNRRERLARIMTRPVKPDDDVLKAARKEARDARAEADRLKRREK